jgi:hypothetical protein
MIICIEMILSMIYLQCIIKCFFIHASRCGKKLSVVICFTSKKRYSHKSVPEQAELYSGSISYYRF